MSTQQFIFTFSSIQQVTAFAEAWLNGAKDLPKSAPQKHRIEEASISARTVNVLRAERLEYMEDALEYGRFKLAKIPTVGKKALDEIEAWAKQFDMWWKP